MHCNSRLRPFHQRFQTYTLSLRDGMNCDSNAFPPAGPLRVKMPQCCAKNYCSASEASKPIGAPRTDVVADAGLKVAMRACRFGSSWYNVPYPMPTASHARPQSRKQAAQTKRRRTRKQRCTRTRGPALACAYVPRLSSLTNARALLRYGHDLYLYNTPRRRNPARPVARIVQTTRVRLHVSSRMSPTKCSPPPQPGVAHTSLELGTRATRRITTQRTLRTPHCRACSAN